jgi:hypothetical protein
MFAKYNATFDFTALEMTDNDGNGCACGPQELVSARDWWYYFLL